MGNRAGGVRWLAGVKNWLGLTFTFSGGLVVGASRSAGPGLRTRSVVRKRCSTSRADTPGPSALGYRTSARRRGTGRRRRGARQLVAARNDEQFFPGR